METLENNTEIDLSNFVLELDDEYKNDTILRDNMEDTIQISSDVIKKIEDEIYYEQN